MKKSQKEWTKKEIDFIRKRVNEIEGSTRHKAVVISKELGRSISSVRSKILRIKAERDEIEQKNKEISRLKQVIREFEQKQHEYNIPVDGNSFRFGAIGDTHIGSLYFKQDALLKFYEYLRKQKCEVVFHAGDILDGHKVYPGHEFEVEELGFELQLEKFKEYYPDFIPTQAITGNHDASFKKQSGIMVGTQLASVKKNFTFLGEDVGEIVLQKGQRKIRIQLLHPGRSIAYSLSYILQKVIESLPGGQKPDILISGHIHTAICMPMYRNVLALQAGTFQTQTPFQKRRALHSHLGGWLIEVNFGNKMTDLSSRFKMEFVSFYENSK